jgi:RND family efflux transporter MFP subunit
MERDQDMLVEAGEQDAGRPPEEVLPEPRPGRTRRRGLLVACALGIPLLALLLVGYLPKRRRQQALEAAARSQRDSLPTVNVVRVERAPARTDLLLPGNVQAFTDSPIYARADGYLGRRHVDIGDRVKAGQVLAEIETPDLDEQVRQARASLLQARAALAQAQANLAQAQSTEHLANVTADRWSVLVSRGVLARQDGDQKQADYEVAVATRKAQEANVNAARNSVSAAEANLGRLLELQGFKKVTAPFSGLITARNVDVGALITSGNASGKELFHLAAINVVRIFINAPQSSAPFIRTGQPADVSVEQLPGRTFSGKVTRTADSLDPGSRTLLTEVDAPNPDSALLPGMYAEVRLVNVRTQPPLLVPGDALVTRPDGIRVAVVDDGNRVRFQEVRPGRDFGTETEILSGLKRGELVVVNPTDQVREGVEVKPLALREPPRTSNSAPDDHPQTGKPPSAPDRGSRR